MSDLGVYPVHLQIGRSSAADRLVLALRGELDLASAPLLEQELRDAEAGDRRHVVIDLSALEFMDSTGIELLVRAQRSADRNGHHVSLRRGPAQVQRLFELTGLVGLFAFEN